MNIIFHIDDTSKWTAGISNLQHMSEWLIANQDPGHVELALKEP